MFKIKRLNYARKWCRCSFERQLCVDDVKKNMIN